MPKGGARARSGPPPDPNALRRERDEGEWVTLPQAGREGPLPDWPLVGFSDRESGKWEQLWSMPQALMWERHRQFDEVAIYVRQFTVAEDPEASTASRTLLRQMGDSLGLTTPGLRSHRWKIEPVVAVTSKPAGSPAPFRPRVVAPDAVEPDQTG